MEAQIVAVEKSSQKYAITTLQILFQEVTLKLVYAKVLCLLMLSSSASMADENRRIADIKSEILDLGRQYVSEIDKADEARSLFEPLIYELAELVPVETEAEKRSRVAGAWKNVWSYRSFRGVNNEQSYQIVNENGYYWNFAELNIAGLSFSYFLRGAFTDEGEQLRIEFTSSRARYGFLKKEPIW